MVEEGRLPIRAPQHPSPKQSTFRYHTNLPPKLDTMVDSTKYRQHKTSRGYTYNYYFSPASGGKPYLFLAHGFPSCAYLWRKQIAFFEPLGYGLIVPDLLGFGGTDKPTDVSAYYGSGLAQDINDILDKEGIAKVISVSHDWGHRVVSRLWNYYPDRLTACVFLATGYGPPTTAYSDPINMIQEIAKWIGYDVLAYMLFFLDPGTADLAKKNFDAFMSLLFPLRGKLWRHNMCTMGGAQRWMETNTILPTPEYLTPEDYDVYRKNLLEGGFEAPLCWYKVQVDDGNKKDDARIPEPNYDITVPIYYINFTDDWISREQFADMSHGQYAKGPYKKDYLDCDHWGVLSHAEVLDPMMLTWIESLNA